MKCPKCQST